MKLKFRAWDKKNKTMHEVELIDFIDNIGYLSIEDGRGDWYSFEVDTILMQSTGLKDKNGVEIFEGDIVKKTNGSIGYVVYLQQEAGFVVVLKKSDYRLGHRNTGEPYKEATNHEIIGNVYENPELLEVK